MATRISQAIRTSDALKRARRYFTVGALGTVIDVALFATLRLALGLPALVANTASYSAGIVNNYALNRRWTYGDRPRKAFGTQFAQFAAISCSALALNNLLIALLAPKLGVLLGNPAYGALAAKAYATGIGMCWNFVANHLWTFREPAPAAVGGESANRPDRIASEADGRSACPAATRAHAAAIWPQRTRAVGFGQRRQPEPAAAINPME